MPFIWGESTNLKTKACPNITFTAYVGVYNLSERGAWMSIAAGYVVNRKERAVLYHAIRLFKSVAVKWLCIRKLLTIIWQDCFGSKWAYTPE